jgi:hypothetical protein
MKMLNLQSKMKLSSSSGKNVLLESQNPNFDQIKICSTSLFLSNMGLLLRGETKSKPKTSGAKISALDVKTNQILSSDMQLILINFYS